MCHEILLLHTIVIMAYVCTNQAGMCRISKHVHLKHFPKEMIPVPILCMLQGYSYCLWVINMTNCSKLGQVP